MYYLLYMYWQACESLPLLLTYVINIFFKYKKRLNKQRKTIKRLQIRKQIRIFAMSLRDT